MHDEPQRKKVRKGTTSCWECKRRKVRCSGVLAAPSGGVCDGCRRRGRTCISQEFPDAPSSRGGIREDRGDSDRLGRVEALVEELVAKSGGQGHHDVAEDPLQLPSSNASAARGPPAVAPFPERQHCSFDRPGPASSSLTGTTKFEHTSRGLLQAWPAPHELNLILKAYEAVGIPGLLVKVASYTIHTDLPCDEAPTQSPQDVLVLPPPASHPVLIARKLLLLAMFLQYLRPYAYQVPDTLPLTAEACSAIMSRVMDAVTTLVTDKDELVGSVEGIECIMLESLYHDTAGNLRRSWVTTRRAMVMAQMMGLHRGRAKVLEPETRARFSAQHMWFRLVQLDRYLSLMLGLPQGCSDNVFATPKALQSCKAVQRLRRIQTVAGGRIIERNDAQQEESCGLSDLATTLEIDTLLQRASECMQPSWWLLETTTDGEGRPFLGDADTMRLMDHVAHFNLVVQLHLPYLLRPPTNHAYDYNKMTVISASREVLTRFIMFRRAYPVGASCRGVDFLAFIAIAALSLAHLEGRRWRNDGSALRGGDGGSSHNIFDSLAHQRATDRGLMERAVESMESMGRVTTDILSSKLATVLGHLLAIEQEAASDNGSYYNTEITPPSALGDGVSDEQGNEEQASGCSGKVSESGNVLYMHIPYYGTVKVERCHGLSRYGTVQMSALGGTECLVLPGVTQTGASGYAQTAHGDMLVFDDEELNAQNMYPWDPELAACADNWTLQGVETAFFGSLFRGSTEGQVDVDAGSAGDTGGFLAGQFGDQVLD